MGLYHPHEELHHIKKENIGLIEVMGLAILPGRLKKEMADLKTALLNGENLRENEELAKHADWADEFMVRHRNSMRKTPTKLLSSKSGRSLHKCWNVRACTNARWKAANTSKSS